MHGRRPLGRKKNSVLRRGRYSKSPFHKSIEDRYFHSIRKIADSSRKPSPEEKAMTVVYDLCNPRKKDLREVQAEFVKRLKKDGVAKS